MTPHRERAIAWAQRIVNDPTALVIDTETRGKEHDAGIIDLAIITIGGDVLFDWLIYPGKPIPAEATAIHGITDDDLDIAPTWKMVYPRIAEIIAGRVVSAYNSAFDAGCVNAECRALGLPEIAQDWQCCMLAFSDWDGTPSRFGSGFAWHRLENAAKSLGIEPGGHRALADAEATRQVILKMASYTETPSQTEPVAVTVQPSLFSVETPVDSEKWRR